MQNGNFNQYAPPDGRQPGRQALPCLPEDLQCRCWFEFGSAEDHLKYRAAVRKAYPHGHHPIFEGCNHMQYQIRDPQGFAAMLTSIIEQNVLPPLPFVKSA